MDGRKGLSRRRLLGAGALAVVAQSASGDALAKAVADGAPAPSLAQMVMQPFLAKALYHDSFSGEFDPNGACEVNRKRFLTVGFQRWGADWVTQGLAVGRPDWVARGWRQLDYGLAHQNADGGFGGPEVFFSGGQFIEALARACTLDPANGGSRLAALERAAVWHMSPAVEAVGVPQIRPYTHRRYLFAAGLGMTARLTGDANLRRRAELWARDGIGLQTPEGVNPEAGGFDANYQMIGLLFAMRYLAVCDSPPVRAALRNMARKAYAVELARMNAAGRIDERYSTRVGHEKLLNGKLKTVSYREATLSFAYGAAALSEPQLLQAAAETAAIAR